MADMRPPSGSNCTLQATDFGCFTVEVNLVNHPFLTHHVFRSWLMVTSHLDHLVFVQPPTNSLGWPHGYGCVAKAPFKMAICIGNL